MCDNCPLNGLNGLNGLNVHLLVRVLDSSLDHVSAMVKRAPVSGRVRNKKNAKALNIASANGPTTLNVN